LQRRVGTAVADGSPETHLRSEAAPPSYRPELSGGRAALAAGQRPALPKLPRRIAPRSVGTARFQRAGFCILQEPSVKRPSNLSSPKASPQPHRPSTWSRMRDLGTAVSITALAMPGEVRSPHHSQRSSPPINPSCPCAFVPSCEDFSPPLRSPLPIANRRHSRLPIHATTTPHPSAASQPGEAVSTRRRPGGSVSTSAASQPSS
jgi:hypothetical protein